MKVDQPYFLTTLTHADPETNFWSLYCNRPGGRSTSDTTYNMGSDIRVLHRQGQQVTEDVLQVGIQGGEHGVIIDLGDSKELQDKYPPSGDNIRDKTFVSMAFRPNLDYGGSKEHMILTVARESGSTVSSYYYLKETDPLLDFVSSSSRDQATVKLNHVYVLLIWRESQVPLLVAKFKVVDHRPGHSVSIRHQTMYVVEDSSTGRHCPNGPGDDKDDKRKESSGGALAMSIIGITFSVIAMTCSVVAIVLSAVLSCCCRCTSRQQTQTNVAQQMYGEAPAHQVTQIPQGAYAQLTTPPALYGIQQQGQMGYQQPY